MAPDDEPYYYILHLRHTGDVNKFSVYEDIMLIKPYLHRQCQKRTDSLMENPYIAYGVWVD